MTWNSASPSGTLSVRANRTPMNQNTSYIETTLGNTVSDIAYATSQKDHFWDVSSDLDGHHRWVKMPAFTVGGTPSDPGSPLGTGIDGMIYFRRDSADSARTEGFFRNTEGIYQFIPAFKSGSVAVPSSGSYSTVDSVPANVYGEITMFTTALGKYSSCVAHFRSNATTVEAWTFTQADEDSTANVPLKFANGSDASGLNLRARRSDAASATWNYRITWRAI